MPVGARNTGLNTVGKLYNNTVSAVSYVAHEVLPMGLLQCDRVADEGDLGLSDGIHASEIS